MMNEYISKYLRVGSSFDNTNYKIPTKINMSFEDAVDRYEEILIRNINELNESNPLYTLSGGLDSSLIWSYIDKPRTMCVQVNGNEDFEYAMRLCPTMYVDRGFNNIDIEKTLFEIQSIWDTPHCMRSDLYDYYVHQIDNNIILGDDPIHFNFTHWIMNNRMNLKHFIDEVSIFTDDEIQEFGYTPYEFKLKTDNMFHVIYFIFDWWTSINRKIVFHHKDTHKSPYLTREIVDFYMSMPLKFQKDKQIIRELVARRLPEYIQTRKKFHPGEGKTQWAFEHKNEIINLKNKYLKDKDMKMFNYLDYDLVQKHIKDYIKMWRLLNLCIWIEINK